MIELDLLRQQIDQRLLRKVDEEFGLKSALKEACLYALRGPAKRWRPIIVLLVAEGIGKGWDAWEVALGVEFFHTASLIADDLPCMDDDSMRRNRPSLHRAFPESVALLASYAFIAAGYRTLWQNEQQLPSRVSKEECLLIAQLALENATENTGILGATGGQYLDLFCKELDRERLMEIFHAKTATFFEIAFVLGWLFGGGERARLPEVKALALHLGLAFQIADDFHDVGQAHGVNLVACLGVEASKKLLKEEWGKADQQLKALHLDHTLLRELLDSLIL